MLQEIEIEQGRVAAKAKQLDDLGREREILNKSVRSAEDKTAEAASILKVQANARKNLENEIAGFRNHVRRQREQIEDLQDERQRYHEDAEAANQKYFTALEQVKLQELQVSALQKKISDGDAKLKQQQNLYVSIKWVGRCKQ